MRKSVVIATCLLNSRMVASLEAGESAVRAVYADMHRTVTFSQWNLEMPESAAMHVIKGIGRAMEIHVDRLIAELD